MRREVVYFEKPGRHNTDECIEIIKRELSEGRIRHLVVATTGGDTALRLCDAIDVAGVNLVAVTHSYGFREPNTIEITPEDRNRLEERGVKVYTGTMITHNVETAFASKFGGLYPTTLIAQTLRRFGEGPKVCCEIVLMAADAGLIPEGEEVLSVAGTGRGADTVMIIRAATSKRFLDLRVLEILAKPRG
ncbi:MAG: hypothetical protein D6726_07980 [Nitrospirae bacterium]|nr:MAG: hypothetical protein D6726_07980 [Nitrospirota bacterium]